jgi:CHAT domain-containing protein/tetratricopeptide (TPR) repeat protein
MPDIRLSGNSDLLSSCALLRWFDHDLLSDVAAHGEDEIEALLASDLVETASEHPGAYRLHDDIRAEALARLRAENPLDELTWHMRFFDYFLRQMQESGPNDRRAIAEDTVLYHLGELFLLIAARQEWHILIAHVTAVRAANPREARTYHWLNFYEGFASIRTQDYDRGEIILTALLSYTDVENKLRIQVLNALGQAHWFQGRYDRGLAMYQQVLTLARQTNNLFYQGIALANMGWIYEGIGKYEQALTIVTQSLAIFRDLHDEYREAQALYDIGIYAMRVGRWQVARSHFLDAIQLYEALNILPRLAHLYWGQGFLHHMLGDELESEKAYLRARTITETHEHGQPDLALDIHFQMGFLYQAQGRWGEALASYDRANSLAAQLRDQYSATFIHYRRGNVFERQSRLEEAYNAYRAAIEGIEALRGATKTEEIKIGLLGTAQQVYESMIVLLLKLDRQAEAFEYVERARSRAFLDLLSDKSPELYDAIDQPVATLAEVQQRLPADALLVEYFTIGVLPRGESLINMLPPENTRLREHLTLPPQVLVFAVTRDRLEIFRPETDPNTLRPQSLDPGPGKRMLRDRLLARLHTQLIEPLAELLPSRRLLYLIPHGPLHYVPFMALRSAEGAYLLAADGPAIALAPSATILLRNCLGRSQAMSRHSVPLLALGYNDEGEDALRYAEAEARHIARMLGGPAWTGPASKSARLLGEAGRARWLHIAGHAYYDPHDPLGSALKLGADDLLSARAIIEKLELTADLVTLSACQSGVTHVMPGDEMLGLQRAFLYAGAPAVVCTLWETADLVALLVMDRFYADLRRGIAPATALRDAQVAVRDMTGRDLTATIARWRDEDPEFIAAIGELPAIPTDMLNMRIYADPIHWAPFMLIGRAD